MDEYLFGWDDTQSIVSVWADREGRALIWQREGERLTCVQARYRPWLFAAHLDDLAHLDRGVVREDTSPPAPLGLAVETQHVASLTGATAPPSLPREGNGGRDPAFTYRRLDGPPDTYRYLISAASGRGLERALVAGASRRLGKVVESLYDLDDYYRVGPVEQYLMATGRVYYRGLTYADLHRLQFDLETTALDPARGRIFLVAVRDSQGLATTLEAPTPDDEARLIRDLVRLVQERDPDVIENHNLFGFDLPFLERRAQAHGIPLALGRRPGPLLLQSYAEPGGAYNAPRRTRYSLAGRELIDTLDAVWRHDFVVRDLPSHRLKDVARHFGVAAPERTYVAGADVFATYRQDPATIRRYALDDVAEVDALSQRLLGAPFALAGMAPRRYERLSSAGPAMGILEPLLVRAYLRAGAALPRYQSGPGLGQHAGGAAYLFAAGLAEHVVKADVASLYPSIMRVFGVGPAPDRLGVLLKIVDRMTSLRLQHKAAAREATPASLAAGHHQAMQAAMKLLINSAYGYMGAGAMALFADGRAADEVTRRGRETLDQVVAALRARGVALIEADTDGVYFAVPDGWTEAQERALVADVAAQLPAGLNLEYEGRYQAMFSHEIKNYALLTYDGRLIVRGAAMRSSRSEPFGERFLQTALHCLMRGDVPGVRRAYLDTREALRRRELTSAEVASRVRLSKSAETYGKTRARGREAQYEALLAAGRTSWGRGERVRFYRHRDGGYVWLPDETEETLEEGDWQAEEGGNGGETVVGWDGEVLTVPPTSVGVGDPSAHDYDVDTYRQVLLTSYAARLKKAFAPADFDQLFRLHDQAGLFDRPVEQIQPLWIRPAREGS